MTEKKQEPVANAQAFEPVQVDAPKLTAEEQKAADARAAEEALRERLVLKAEAARFVRVRAED